MIHHPCQIAHPDWSSTADENQTDSATTRDVFLAKYSDRPVLIIGTHFAAPTAGYIVAEQDTLNTKERENLPEQAWADSNEGKAGVDYRLDY